MFRDGTQLASSGGEMSRMDAPWLLAQLLLELLLKDVLFSSFELVCCPKIAPSTACMACTVCYTNVEKERKGK